MFNFYDDFETMREATMWECPQEEGESDETYEQRIDEIVDAMEIAESDYRDYMWAMGAGA